MGLGWDAISSNLDGGKRNLETRMGFVTISSNLKGGKCNLSKLKINIK